uniref:Putative K-exchanger-like protein n=1 Tax=Zea mays TaxID=4577 RepID=Q6JAE1_MAIZE|nr:putative K-exchanger-like protein [Zea mays]
MALTRGRARTAPAVPSACFLLLLLLLLTSSSLLAAPTSGRAESGGGSVLGDASSSSGKARGDSCEELQSISGGEARCAYLRAQNSPCSPAGYVDYLRLFYCAFAGAPAAAACAALALWLAVLFYLLGDTASEYFCASLEGLSAALRLPPAVAGVTLLSLGNGAPDVFASVVSFASGDDGGGGVTVWVAASFVSLYVGYVVLVWTSHCCTEKGKPAADSLSAPLLLDDDDDVGDVVPSLPSHTKTEASSTATSRVIATLHCLAAALCMPLYLPRRLTIPDIAGHRWSRPYAVASAALAPVLIAVTWSSQRHNPTSWHGLAVLVGGALLGLLLAALAAATTDASSPPRGRRRRVPWLAAGFVMSVLWAYTLARELVALLVAIGYVAGIKPSVLGVTVLAWGDSLGDLVSNVAMAVHGGPGGAQTAVSGCYAGPLFNTVVGLGLSLALAAGAQHPAPFAVPVDAAAYEAVGFLGAALAWALFVVPVRGMRIDRVYGVGLIAIYLCFFAVRVSETLGLWS